MELSDQIRRVVLLAALAVTVGMLLLSVGSGVAVASDEEGDSRGAGKNAAREAYCQNAPSNECGSFCFWAMCNECPQCCDDECDCDISGEQACASKGQSPTCGIEVEYEECDTDPDTGEDDCTTIIVCETCGTQDCQVGCCGWEWWMYSQGKGPFRFGEDAVNPRLAPAVEAAVRPPEEIQDCETDQSPRTDETYEGTTPEDDKIEPDLPTLFPTLPWYATREPVGVPRRLPVGSALHEYPGEDEAVVLQDVVQQQNDDEEWVVMLVTGEEWENLEYRMWPYGGRVPNDRLPAVDDPVTHRPDLPQRSQIVQWRSVPEDGELPQPSLLFNYEYFDHDNSFDYTGPFNRIGNDPARYPPSGGVITRNFYDWAIYAFQLRRKDDKLVSNSVNALLFLGLESDSNPCPEDDGPVSNVCGFRLNDPPWVTLAHPPGAAGFGQLTVPGVQEAWGTLEGFRGVVYPDWLRPANDWYYRATADIGVYETSPHLLDLLRTPAVVRVQSPEVHPSFTATWVVDPDTGEDDVEFSFGTVGAPLSDGWIDMRIWPHTGNLSAATVDHKWYHIGAVQGQTLRLKRDLGGVLRCWRYRSDNFPNVESGCGVDDDEEQNTEPLMEFTNHQYEVFRNWRNWNFQIRVLTPRMGDSGALEGLDASSPSYVQVVMMGDPVKQRLDGEDLAVLTDDRPHAQYDCGDGWSHSQFGLVDQFGNEGARNFRRGLDCDETEPFVSYFDVELEHPGPASDDQGALEPNTPGWEYLLELGKPDFTITGGADPQPVGAMCEGTLPEPDTQPLWLDPGELLIRIFRTGRPSATSWVITYQADSDPPSTVTVMPGRSQGVAQYILTGLRLGSRYTFTVVAKADGCTDSPARTWDAIAR